MEKRLELVSPAPNRNSLLHSMMNVDNSKFMDKKIKKYLTAVNLTISVV
jgi:hypothetical protein